MERENKRERECVREGKSERERDKGGICVIRCWQEMCIEFCHVIGPNGTITSKTNYY